MEEKDKPTQPVSEVMENPDTTIKNLAIELAEARATLERIAKENQILRATVKALTQLL